jgi:enoyl-CoA hydratase/carnithine racemase
MESEANDTNDGVLFTVTGKIARVTLNEPEKLNTFTVEKLNRMADIVDEITANDKIRCVIFDAMGDKAFSAGLDTKMLSQGDSSIGAHVLEAGSILSKKLFYMPVPAICSIAAPAVGWGCILSMLCDLRYAVQSTYFKLPELEIGIYPATGALTLCLMQFGPSLGMEMMLLGKKVSVEQAAGIGFVNGMAATREEVDELAMNAAKACSRLNQQVVMYTKMNAKLVAGKFNAAVDLEARCFRELLEEGKNEDWHATYLKRFEALKQDWFSSP